MATIGTGDEFIVFKFAESGLVALCQEVADLVASGEAARRHLDLSSAEYVLDGTGQHNIVFAYEGGSWVPPGPLSREVGGYRLEPCGNHLSWSLSLDDTTGCSDPSALHVLPEPGVGLHVVKEG